MPIVDINTLKSYFNDGDVPTESDYIDLIDTAISGNMAKSVYDTNSNNIVDAAESVPWTGITGKPSTFAPSAHTHPGGDITSAVANANAVPWTGITGKPSTFTPSAHTHGGSDITSAVANANAVPWTGITGKPSTFTPSAHTHAGGDITSAVASATNADTVDSLHASSFAPSGYGLGTAVQTHSTDWNTVGATGFYRGNQLANGPASSYYYVVSLWHSATYQGEEATYYYSAGNPRKYIRRMVNGTWEAWKSIYPAQWDNIESKPSTFTPSTHTHAGTDITSAVAVATSANDSDTLDTYHASAFYRLNTTMSTTGDLNTTGNVRAAGGIVSGNSGVTPTAGEVWINSSSVKLSDNGTYNGLRITNSAGTVDIQPGGAANLVYLETSLDYWYITKGLRTGDSFVSVNGTWDTAAGSVSNAMYFAKDTTHGRLELNMTGTGYIYIGNAGSGAGTRQTHIMNGNAGYGDIHADNFVNESRLSSKKDIKSMKDEFNNSALKTLERLNPVSFTMINGGHSRRKLGLIAEDVYEILPQVVSIDSFTNEPSGIAYGQIVPLLIEAVKELSEEVRRLKT